MNRYWFVPCDKCHRKWVSIDCPTEEVYDEITYRGMLYSFKEDLVKEDTVTVKFPRQVITYDKVFCGDCRGKGGPKL